MLKSSAIAKRGALLVYGWPTCGPSKTIIPLVPSNPLTIPEKRAETNPGLAIQKDLE
jgi:hypothetical protein